MRYRSLIVFITAAMAVGMLPAAAVPTPVIASDNVELLAQIPDLSAISTEFATDKPLMYVNSMSGISVYDISNPALPLLKSHLQLPHFENEGMTLGERAGGAKFLLIGIDALAVAPAASRPFFVGTGLHHLYLVDVTDPAAPRLRGNVDTVSSSHTIACVNQTCEYAYTSGSYNGGDFHVVDLTNLDAPKVVKKLRNVAGAGHQWDVDDAGILWSTGFDGAAAYDVTDPLIPKALSSTNAKGTQTPYNDFIMHNSYRPHADKFSQVPDEATGRLVSGNKETASVFDESVTTSRSSRKGCASTTTGVARSAGRSTSV